MRIFQKIILILVSRRKPKSNILELLLGGTGGT